MVGFKQFQLQSGATGTKEIQNLDYNIAYTYFKLKNYPEATQYFQNFININKQDKLRLNDAYLRLGDGYFVSSDYTKAISAYDKAIEIHEIESDYADFQKTMSYGYLGKNDTKIKDLNTFIAGYPKSSLRDDAMYELANSYIKAGQTDQAMKMYDRLNSEYKNIFFGFLPLINLAS